MIKKTLYFGNPAYLSLKLGQIIIRRPEDQNGTEELTKTVPIEDVGIVILDNRQITITQALLEELLANCCAVISCDKHHLPTGLFLPLESNTVQNERFNEQIKASLPLKKQLWQQTIAQKIMNQAEVLKLATGETHGNMMAWSAKVRSGDPDNLEGRAAAYYWKTIFPEFPEFVRGREETPPNGMLNYGYGILRAVIARAIVSSGMLPTLGIHHHNRYNAFCLADDIMEPYRPFVDKTVLDILKNVPSGELTQDAKTRLLNIPAVEVIINGKRRPLMVAASTTTASLVKCFSGESRKILYPEI